MNIEKYPDLMYPDIYLLKGGYSRFFKKFPVMRFAEMYNLIELLQPWIISMHERNKILLSPDFRAWNQTWMGEIIQKLKGTNTVLLSFQNKGKIETLREINLVPWVELQLKTNLFGFLFF